MKKTLIVFMLVLLSLVLVVSCDDNSKKVYTVTFDSNGGSDVDPVAVTVKNREKVTEPTAPTKSGYVFKYWAREDSEEKFDFGTAITTDITLTALWRKPTTGDTVTLGTVTWLVLDVDTDNNAALLISKDVLAEKKFNNTRDETKIPTYAGSGIQKYLNETTSSDGFFKTYNLSTDYMKRVTFSDGGETTTISGTDSGDYVFLLSKKEAENEKYFTTDAARIANRCSWWLRTPGKSNSHVYYVGDNGKIGEWWEESGSIYVRPAFWYNLND